MVSILRSKLQKNIGSIADFAICSYNIIIKYKKEMALPQCHASFNQFLDQDDRESSGGNQNLKSNVSRNSNVKNSLLQGSHFTYYIINNNNFRNVFFN